ncbi:MAG: nicotinamide riboside transporter PnuC [Flavobacteriaceae bacterium]|jgi:nicotinamide mononucleotide transporter|nr:nicotinamide mononucleotide transporter [Formosa sp.]MDG1374466.1 nicotinamide riboside transporter PnuC [Flavobacteriaceae bacterium]MDG2498316.1 nicotinamide riboside transporter PnuC [Flavobacteriaceae bacterium]
MNDLTSFFLEAYNQTPMHLIVLEAIAFVFGVVSVYYAQKAHILVYPTGIICTIITVYLLYVNQYFGDMMMNGYYSIMSLYGWWNWSLISNNNKVLKIASASFKDKIIGFILCVLTMGVTFLVYKLFDYTLLLPNYIDIFTSGLFFTAMWYMANKKLQNWTLWIVANVITIPLYAYRGLGILSIQYIIFTFLAVQGYRSWKKHLVNIHQTA